MNNEKNKDGIFANFRKKPLKPNSFFAICEIEKCSKNKYEFDLETGFLKLDRILYTSTHYPHNYGFIPLTLSDDGDPLDVLIISSEPILPLSIVECRPIGVLEMVDGGKKDYKIMAVCKKDPFYNQYNDISELPSHVADEIKHFFKVYKSLENKSTDIGDLEGHEKAEKVVEMSIEAYEKSISQD